MITIQEPTLAIHSAYKWVLVTPLVVQTSEGTIITVPAGFKTDLASIPRALQSVIPVNGKHRIPAILHDYLYSHGDKMFNKEESDLLFLEAMKAYKVNAIQRTAMYLAVKYFGQSAWEGK